MRKIKIVADSSANLLEIEGVSFASAPLRIVTADREFVDDAALDLEDMLRYFDTYKGKSKTSCPGAGDWLSAFGDADEIFCVTITSGLSGSYNAALNAARMYESEHEGARVCVIDSLSAGPELALIVEKLVEYIGAGMSFEEITAAIAAYTRTTGLLFILESLKNFAANGRVSPAVAKLAGLLGIRIVGKASDKGQLEPLHKCRGEAKALSAVLNELAAAGLAKGKIRISHCRNEEAALRLSEMIRKRFTGVEPQVISCRGLCSYYAEVGGILLAYEKM